MKQSDITLIKIVSCVLILFLAFNYLIMPAITRYQDNVATEDALTLQLEEMQNTISLKPTVESTIEVQETTLNELNEGFYDLMANQEIDELMTGLVLEHDLFPVYLSIGDRRQSTAGAYENRSGTITGGSVTETLPYIYTSTVTLTVEGSKEEVDAFTDDITLNYPGIALVSYDLSTGTYANADLEAVEIVTARCEFAIFMVDDSLLEEEAE